MASLFDYTEHPYSNRFKGKCLACNLHCHSDQSLDGGSTVKNLMRRAHELEYTHFTLSEHGNVNSAASVFRYAEELKKKEGINLKVFHSVEAYIRHPNDLKSSHITIGFKTQAAFEYYCSITPLIYSPPYMEVKGGDIKPVMTLQMFEELASKGITVGTGCVGSFFNMPILKSGDWRESKKRLDWVVSLVGHSNVYDEWIIDDLSKTYKSAMYHKETKVLLRPAYLETNECIPHFVDLGYDTPDVGKAVNYIRRKYVTSPAKIKPLASLDAHYAYKKDKIVQDAKLFGNDWVMSSFQHLRGAEEYALDAMKNEDLPERFIEALIDNTADYAEQFGSYKFRTAKDGWLLPEYPDSNREYLMNIVTKLGKVDASDPVIAERLQYEMDTLNPSPEFDALSYIRMTTDIVELAQDNGILVNARGSVGGSLLAYATGITVTDPLKYDLPFERFITKGRIQAGVLPDADLDFSDKDKIMALLREKYGDRMASLSTDSLLKPRSAIKDAERAILGAVRQETEMLTKSMPIVPQGTDETGWLFGYELEGEHIKGFFEQSRELQEYAKYNPEIWDLVVRMCGVQRQKSVHACGLVILPKPVASYFPVYRVGGSAGELATAYNPKDIEYVGGVKIDILGVKKMMTVDLATRLIKERHGVSIPWGEYPHDPEVYEKIYAQGNTSATFQTNTAGISQLGVDTRPATIEEISINIALYRPSCLDWEIVDPAQNFKGNAVEFYVQYRKGNVEPRYIHPSLEPILGSTAGTPIYQEQLLRIFRDIGDMSYEQAEIARRAIGKKDQATLLAEAEKLTNACLRKGWTPEQGRELFDMVLASSRYGFNRAHSTSYAIVSYNTAYLKHKYPLEFWAAELSCEYDNEDKLRSYADDLGDLLLRPDVMVSHPTQFVISGEKLQAPLCVIKGIGETFAQDLRAFIDLDLESSGLTKKPVKEKPVKKVKEK